MLEGIKIKILNRRPIGRAFFTELMRGDWTEILGEDKFVQANLSITYPGIIRAWHRHRRGQVDYFIALKGTLKICAYDSESMELEEIISSGQQPQVVRIPRRYWHGFKAVGNEVAWLLYFVNEFYDYNDPNEERRPWNDPKIVPESINGRTDDPRAGKLWDWNYPPQR